MRTTLIAGLAIVVLAIPAGAQQQAGPVVNAGGKHSPVPDANFAIPRDLAYKVVWDINVGAAKPVEANALFEVPPRFVNQGAVIGLPRANVQAAVVVHGGAGEELLANDEYKARKGVDNPNIALLSEMSKAGIRIILCGQTMANKKMPKDKLLPFVEIAASAAWAHAVLARQGYTLNPF
jgi:intracellular sulfur oxidation DsrE/DsrF family protein